MEDKKMVTAVNEVSLIIKVEKKDKFEVRMGTVSGMTELCCDNHQIYCKVNKGEIHVTSYRGNKPGWKNITGKWLDYAKQLTARKLPEDFMKMLGMSSDDKPIANVNDCFDGGDSAEDSAVSTVVNTATITDDARSGAEVLKEAISKNPKHVQEKVDILAGCKDSTAERLEELFKSPNYAAKKNNDGTHTLIKKGDIEVRVKAVIIKENRNVVPHVYICNVKTGFISKMFPVTSSNIRNGGTKLKNELKNVGGLFSDKEIDMAHAKLLILVMKNIISSVEDESMSYSDILSYYKDYITSALDKRYDEKDSEYCPSVIVEKKDNGSIIIGVRNTDFDNIYEKLVAESEVMNERTFKKQGKVLGDLSPDAGRGGGDHILGEKYSPRYGMSPNERMQRFSYTADEANELWKQEAKFREKHPELVSYVHQEKEVQS